MEHKETYVKQIMRSRIELLAWGTIDIAGTKHNLALRTFSF
jgi:hypothetical protein